MARIRSVKPETWSDVRFCSLTLPARLTYIALWNYADDEGRGRFLPKAIEGFAWPLDDLSAHGTTIEAVLDEIRAINRIVVYQVDGEPFFHIPTFADHQRPNRPTASRLPEPPDNGEGAILPPPQPPGAIPGQPAVSIDLDRLEAAMADVKAFQALRQRKDWTRRWKPLFEQTDLDVEAWIEALDRFMVMVAEGYADTPASLNAAIDSVRTLAAAQAPRIAGWIIDDIIGAVESPHRNVSTRWEGQFGRPTTDFQRAVAGAKQHFIERRVMAKTGVPTPSAVRAEIERRMEMFAAERTP